MVKKKVNPKKKTYQRYKIAALVIMVPVLSTLLFVALVYSGVWGRLPNTEELSDIQHQKASEVYSADSVLIGKYFLNDRQPIAYEKFPQYLIDALLAIEDERFYDHTGTDFKSLVRVGFKSILLGDESSGGGSTLTQQLAKNLYPRKDRKSSNLAIQKVQEIIIAKRLEKVYSKKEILHLYLNTVSFGDNTFGIESASRKFFNKPTEALKIEEMAVLVGMLKATYGYNPRIFLAKSLERRNLVLSNMVRNDFISIEEKDSLQQLPLQLDYRDYDYSSGLAPYFREAVRKQLLDWAKDSEVNIYTSGLKIYTTLDYRMQRLAEEAMWEHMSKLQADFEKAYGKNAPWHDNRPMVRQAAQKLPKYKNLKESGLSEKQIWDSLSTKKLMKLPYYDGEKEVKASVLDSLRHFMKFLNVGSLGIDPHSGAVKSWIGGINFDYFKYDHISQSQRQVGSTFKPIVYTAALENGIEPCNYFSAREVEYKNLKSWSPSNAGDDDEAYMNYSMEKALSESVNTVTVKILEETGMEKVLEQAKKLGIETELPNEPSIALGTGEIKVTEMAGAYASYVNKGRPIKPYLVQTVTTDADSVLYNREKEKEIPQAMSEDTRMLILEMMKATVNSGTASRIRKTYGLKNEIAGKTGTTQKNKDAWFAAITPNYINVTWVGHDNHEIGFTSTALGQGANAALPVFAKLYQKMNRDKNFDDITKAKFQAISESVKEKLDCEPTKRDGFFKRLFTNPNKKKKRKFRGG